jgi:hypothetical protein
VRKLFLDFETRSDVDIYKHGLMRYMQSLRTEPVCMAYKFDDGVEGFWWVREAFPVVVIEHIERGGLLYAHGANFERLLFCFV